MTSAEIYQFPATPAGEVRGKRGPQVEDGYTRIANELYEAITNVHTCPVTIRQMRIVLAVIRRTYGFNKTMDRIADTQVAADTGLPRQMVNKAKNELIDMRVLVSNGRQLGVNKHYDEWDFSSRPVKKAPKTKQSQNADSDSKMLTQNVSKDGTHKRQKDMTTSPYGEESTADAARPAQQKKSSLPSCPHGELIDLWAEIMPDKRQPIRSMWTKGARAKNLAARWKQGFSITNEKTGEPLYTDQTSGIEWWGKFMRFLRKSDFLMRDDSRFFGLDWIAKAENFEKILELKYHGGDA